MAVAYPQRHSPVKFAGFLNKVQLSAFAEWPDILRKKSILLAEIRFVCPFPLGAAYVPGGIGEKRHCAASGRIYKTASAMVGMQMGDYHIRNIIRSVTAFRQAAGKP